MKKRGCYLIGLRNPKSDTLNPTYWPIRITGIGKGMTTLIGPLLYSDWCLTNRRLQSCTKFPSPSIHAHIWAWPNSNFERLYLLNRWSYRAETLAPGISCEGL